MIIVCLIIKQNTYLDFREKKHMHSVLGPPFYTSGEGGASVTFLSAPCLRHYLELSGKEFQSDGPSTAKAVDRVCWAGITEPLTAE